MAEGSLLLARVFELRCVLSARSLICSPPRQISSQHSQRLHLDDGWNLERREHNQLGQKGVKQPLQVIPSRGRTQHDRARYRNLLAHQAAQPVENSPCKRRLQVSRRGRKQLCTEGS